MKMDEAFALVGVGLCVFAFCIILLGLGSWQGGNWEAIAQAVISVVGLIAAIFLAAFVLKNIIDRW